mmetsp:Transcript_1351/g.2963  ORF Transcript_1351/g.2963 Transcript_1351/m.2963 type:complete len:85 (-) Transcript_1351:2025-2279(-)
MWNPPAVDTMMARNDQESLTELGNSYKAAIDNVGIKTIMPKDMKDTLRQGGTFVFKGSAPIFEHYDSKVGDNSDIQEILAAIRG